MLNSLNYKHNYNMNNKIRVYVSSLSKYLEGKENGRWLSLPMENNLLEKIFSEITEKDSEYIILDYKAPFEISEHENVFELNKFANNLSDYNMSENEFKVLFEVADTKEEAIKALEQNKYTIINVNEVSKGWSTCLTQEEIYGMVLNKEGYNDLFSQPIPEEMIDYMDFSQIYECLAINNGWQEVIIENITYLATIGL